MNPSTGSGTDEATRSRFGRLWPPLLIALAGMAAYANSFSGPFVFDDPGCIAENPTIRHLWPLWSVLSPPTGGRTVSGRPVTNLTLALNFAVGRTHVWGYHAANLAIHILAGLVLFGIARRTLRSRPGAAFFIALIWTVHPLQTESVTYVIQRAESLMGLFYLLTLYCFIHHAEAQEAAKPAGRPCLFFSLSAFFCLLGMATKEVMVSAPVMAFLYDRTFISGSFREAWRRRRPMYLALASTWIPLACLVIGEGGGRSGTVGFGTGVSWWAYGLTQFQAIVTYLRLAVWPHPLVFEYGTLWVRHAAQVVPCACVVAVLAAATAVGLWRRPAWGFLGFWFFAILAPTSLVPGTTQMIVEHRMYLALAPVLAAIVCGGYAVASGGRDEKPEAAHLREGAWQAVLIVFAGICGVLTHTRNETYRSEANLWADTVAKRPENALAHYNFGTALEKMPGRTNDAIAQYQEALRLKPDYAEAHNNLGKAWAALPGRLGEAIAQYREALRLNPGFPEAHNNLGNAWAGMPGKQGDAIAQYLEALRLKPDYPEACNNLGNIWAGRPGKRNEAIARYQEAIRLNPDYAEAHNNLGNVWAGIPGRLEDAIAEYQEALRLEPNYAEAHYNLANKWLEKPGRVGDSIAQFQEALRLNPNYPEAHNNLGNVWSGMPGKSDDAVAEYQEALRLKPDYVEAHNNLASVFVKMPGHLEDAIAQYQEALRLKPDYAEAHNNLGNLWAGMPGKLDDAIAQYQDALRLRPDYVEAHNNLASALGKIPGRLMEAIAHYQEALRLDPDYADAHYNLAVTLLALAEDRREEARAHLKTCLRLRPNDEAARKALATLESSQR